MEEIFKSEDEIASTLKMNRKAKGTVQVLRIALNKGAHRNLEMVRDLTRRIVGETCSASILFRRTLEFYCAYLDSIIRSKNTAKVGEERDHLLEHLSRKT